MQSFFRPINLLHKSLILPPTSNRCYATQKSLEALKASLATKGFLRSTKPYAPPSNADERVRAICNELKMPSAPDHKLMDLEQKFHLLNACFREFDHSVSNAEMHELSTVGDVIAFYCTALDTISPYDALKRMELPENLHIQYDYVRFHPDKDTKFNGQSAFPKSSTLVTGLKYRKKYEGYEAKNAWP